MDTALHQHAGRQKKVNKRIRYDRRLYCDKKTRVRMRNELGDW